MANIKVPKKLIEVALPLDDINEASGKEKSVRHGHPSTIHPWWASRSLAAARAILFAQLVNDPGGERGWYKGKTKAQADAERERLFDIIRALVKWENSNNESVINAARQEIEKSWRETQQMYGLNASTALKFIDPFNGRGYLPLEAQRLGLETYSSDLNPVAVINGKALIEIPRNFYNQIPVGPAEFSSNNTDTLLDWEGCTGLAEDIRRYAAYIGAICEQELSHLFPKAELPREFGGGKATVLAWLWARTVPSPSPAANGINVPLVSSFAISNVTGREAWVEPVITEDGYEFIVHNEKIPAHAKKGTKKGRGSFSCILTDSPIPLSYIKEMGKAGRMGSKLLAMLVEKDGARFFLSPSPDHEKVALEFVPGWKPSEKLSTHPQYMGPPRYGMETFGDIYTGRQIAVMDKLSSLLPNVYDHAINSGASKEYAKAICTYLGMAISRSADYWSTLATWMPRGTVGHVFATHVIPMTWDYPEANPFSSFHCSWATNADWVAKVVERTYKEMSNGIVTQCDARAADYKEKVVSTDPPYYDNVPYADISDYFYVWQRRALKPFYPELFGSIQTPKSDELVADVKRWGDSANEYFMSGMTQVMAKIANESSPYFPVTIYYAFKQSESTDVKTISRGWEAFLDAVISAGFQITGTWPIRTERGARSRARDSNALASSIVLVCRRRGDGANTISRRDFQRELREEMPDALETMIGGESGQTPIAPVDLAQSAIGPGMAIFSKYEAVLNQDGSKMSVHDALVLINRAITDYLSPESGSFDADTQFCASWFDQYGWSAGPFGEADTLSRAKGTSVDGVREAGVVESGGGKVRLLKWSEYEADWDPTRDQRTPIWEACHQMIRRLNKQGESAAGELLAKMPEKGESIRQLAYHLYTLCERKKWAEEARAYNELIGSWHAIVAASHEVGHAGEQHGLDF
ncbi:DUF1156 domain-containing protein [Microbulbifer thermotolerans]|uniref:DUF1156 domain-containing protein n=1 Tax=Microbulbifer thermotolerans TaxID=252514 RepID=A0AB35I0K4_MICTH|nr:DUF1156 domain-containing protein [Microbulbifer thermotolerans]MCX2803293.1 DUF1156 domain-containing protein [Microbulbifer thermotolerans]